MPTGYVDRAKRNAAIKERFFSETAITRTSDGSNAKALYDAIESQLSAIEARNDEALTNALPFTATGPYLELWMEWASLQRKLSQTAYVEASEEVVRLKPGSGAATFGDLNSGNPISISRGDIRFSGKTRFATDRGAEEFLVEYELLEDVVLQPGDSEAWIGVSALEPGSEYNIGAGQLVSHTFTNYSAYPDLKIEVENVSPIVRGEDDEEEDAIQYRLSRAATARPRGFAEEIATRLNQIPGVSDVLFFTGRSGAGSVDYFIDSQSLIIPTSILDNARDLLRVTNPLGLRLTVEGIERIGISVRLSVVFKPGVQSSKKAVVLNDVKNRIMSHLLSLPAGTSLDLNAMYKDIVIAFPSLSKVGIDERYIDRVIVYRDGLLNQRLGEVVDEEIAVIEVGETERIVPEVSLPEPVVIVENS